MSHTENLRQLPANQPWDIQARVIINNAISKLRSASQTQDGFTEYATDTEYLAKSSSTVAITPANLAALPTFQAYKSVNQTSISAASTPITFDTEEWDVGGYFSSSTYTPPAGKYRLTVALEWTGLNAVDAELLSTLITKNGGADRVIRHARSGTSTNGFCDTFLVEANGTDSFAVRATKAGAGVGTINAGQTITWFCGEAVA